MLYAKKSFSCNRYNNEYYMAHSIVTDFDSTLPCTETTIFFKKPCQNKIQEENKHLEYNANQLTIKEKSVHKKATIAGG